MGESGGGNIATPSAEELAEISRLQEEIRLRREEAESFQALAAAAAAA
jgi:hypothetical protein